MDQYALDDAAMAVLWGLRVKPEEHIGILYDGPKGIQPSNTVSTGSAQNTKGKVQVEGKPRALFHNHPPPKARAIKANRGFDDFKGNGIYEFSDEDKGTARKLRIPSYIITPDGRLRMFNPLNNETTDVLALFPEGQFQEMLIQRSIK